MRLRSLKFAIFCLGALSALSGTTLAQDEDIPPQTQWLIGLLRRRPMQMLSQQGTLRLHLLPLLMVFCLIDICDPFEPKLIICGEKTDTTTK